MKTGRKNLTWIMCAYAVTLACGLGGYVSRVDAQTAESAAASQDMVAADQQLRTQVTAALHAQPYLDDRHINTSVQGGVVVLSGLVYSGWDLRTALHTARKAAGHSRVIDSLTIEEGGR